MLPADEERFRDLIKKFVDGCDFEPPFYLVIIGANGSVTVALHSDCGVEEVCGCTTGAGFAAPLVVTVIGHDGGGKSAKIAIERARVAVH